MYSMFAQYYEEHTFDKLENVREGERAFMSSGCVFNLVKMLHYLYGNGGKVILSLSSKAA